MQEEGRRKILQTGMLEVAANRQEPLAVYHGDNGARVDKGNLKIRNSRHR
jgi:hypothetical protein